MIKSTGCYRLALDPPVRGALLFRFVYICHEEDGVNESGDTLSFKLRWLQCKPTLLALIVVSLFIHDSSCQAVLLLTAYLYN